MNEPLITILPYLGAAGIGFVWGWWCSMRFSLAKKKIRNGLAITVSTLVIIGLSRLHSDWLSGLIFLACMCWTAFLYYLWLQYLRKQTS
jgi:hypothetical protein